MSLIQDPEEHSAAMNFVLVLWMIQNEIKHCYCKIIVEAAFGGEYEKYCIFDREEKKLKFADGTGIKMSRNGFNECLEDGSLFIISEEEYLAYEVLNS